MRTEDVVAWRPLTLVSPRPVSGPGSWSVRVSNSSQNWFYDGTGHATLSFTQDGKYKITGGSNEISGPV